MSPTPKIYNWSVNSTKESNGPSSLGWGVNSFDGQSSTTGWGGVSSNRREQDSGSSSLGYIPTNLYTVNTASSNNNESLPKFSDTFCSSESGSGFNSFKLRNSSSNEFSWSGSSTRRNSSENGLFGDPKKKLDWDGLVENVFKEEIVKLSNTVRNKS